MSDSCASPTDRTDTGPFKGHVRLSGRASVETSGPSVSRSPAATASAFLKKKANIHWRERHVHIGTLLPISWVAAVCFSGAWGSRESG
jgi:hypothetical protein